MCAFFFLFAFVDTFLLRINTSLFRNDERNNFMWSDIVLHLICCLLSRYSVLFVIRSDFVHSSCSTIMIEFCSIEFLTMTSPLTDGCENCIPHEPLKIRLMIYIASISGWLIHIFFFFFFWFIRFKANFIETTMILYDKCHRCHQQILHLSAFNNEWSTSQQQQQQNTVCL